MVIGWGREGEQGISFIKRLRAELRVGLADAKARLERLIEEGTPIIIPTSTPAASTSLYFSWWVPTTAM